MGKKSAKAKILIVDDAAFMRMMIKDILIKNNYEIAGEAGDGVGAVEKFKRLKPDLTIMNVQMPEMNGIEATREIIKFDPSAKIIICSAMGMQPIVIEAIQAGAKDFIVKPFIPERISEAVTKVLLREYEPFCPTKGKYGTKLS